MPLLRGASSGWRSRTAQPLHINFALSRQQQFLLLLLQRQLRHRPSLVKLASDCWLYDLALAEDPGQ